MSVVKEKEVAVLKVDDDDATFSTRSSLSSYSSEQSDPLELDLVLNALKTTLTHEEQPSAVQEDAFSSDDTKIQAPQVVIRNFGNSANLIELNINPNDINVNDKTPRDQEKADEPVLRAIHHLFNNRFMKAKRLFEQQASR
jgi:hypothetical protein